MINTESDTLEKLLSLVAKHFKKERTILLPDSDLMQTLEINSLQALELLTQLEEHFDVEIPDYELQDVRTFKDLSEIIDARL